MKPLMRMTSTTADFPAGSLTGDKQHKKRNHRWGRRGSGYGHLKLGNIVYSPLVLEGSVLECSGSEDIIWYDFLFCPDDGMRVFVKHEPCCADLS